MALQTLSTNATIVDRNISYGIYTDVDSTFSLSGWYFGNQDTFTKIIFPEILKAFPAAAFSSITSKSWLDSLVAEAGEALSQPTTGYSKHDTFYAKSIITKQASPVTLEAWKAFWTYAIGGHGRSEPWFSIINLYGGADSQINVPAVGSSAYGDRDSMFVIQVRLAP